MASGVGVNSDCLEKFQELKLRKKSKYTIFNLNKEKTEIIVEKASPQSDYEAFLGDLPETECRWGVFDLEYDTEDGKRTKLVFIHWSPDSAKIKDKMLAASSKEALRRSLVGIQVEVQASDHSEVAFETVVDKAKRNSK